MIETLRAAWVIGRRDFIAVVFSRAFFFFLLGPVLPLALGIGAGSFSGQIARDIDKSVFALAMAPEDAKALLAAREALATQLSSRRFPELETVDPALADDSAALAALLDEGSDKRYLAVLSGRLADPVLIAPPPQLAEWQGPVELLVARARLGATAQVTLATLAVGDSAGAIAQVRQITAQAGQFLLFMLVVFLASMVLSNLVEEKTNKIIEVLAASVPIDSIFLGKLFAMLVIALIGLATWGALGAIGLVLTGGSLPAMPPPATGWPMFAALGLLYFMMAYLLMGSLFLGIGGMAATVRDVQTLSMPVVMLQMLVFFLAAYAVPRLGEPVELVAIAIPFSSPFAMLARAAQEPALWVHGAAMLYQLVWALLILRFGAWLFRRNVLKSGGAGGSSRRRRSFGRGREKAMPPAA